MKKFLIGLFLLGFIIMTTQVNAMTYSEAIKNKKPVAVFIYADWADNLQETQQSFTTMSQKFGDKYNFVYLNIANKDAKEFNKSFYIYTNLPYVLLFREGGKFNRYLQKDCVMNSSCFEEKLKFFAN